MLPPASDETTAGEENNNDDHLDHGEVAEPGAQRGAPEPGAPEGAAEEGAPEGTQEVDEIVVTDEGDATAETGRYNLRGNQRSYAHRYINETGSAPNDDTTTDPATEDVDNVTGVLQLLQHAIELLGS